MSVPDGARVNVRIVMPIYYFLPVMGGAEQQALRLAGELVRCGHQVTIVTGRWRSTWPARETMDGVQVRRLSTLFGWLDAVRGFFFRHVFFELALAWYLVRNRNRYDLIHVHQALHAAFVATLVARLIGKRVLVKVGCGGVNSDIRIMRENIVNPVSSYFWRVIRGCDLIVAISNEIAAELASDGIGPRKIRNLPNGIRFSADIVKKTYGKSYPIQLVSVGRHDPQKAFDVLIDGLSRLDSRDFRCHIFGDGPQRQMLTTCIEERSLGENVFLPGVVHDLQHRLPGYDIFILASRAEGLSNALMEAMMCGLPCIVSAVGGNTDLVAPECPHPVLGPGKFLIASNGVLVNHDDPDGIAAAIGLLAGDEALRERLGGSASAWIRQHCSLEKVAAGYVELYEELLCRDRSRAQ